MTAWLIENFSDGGTHRCIYDPLLQRAYALCEHDFTPIHGRDGAPIALPEPPEAAQICPQCRELVIR